MRNIRVELQAKSYPVYVTSKRFGHLERLVHNAVYDGRVFVLIDAQVLALHGTQFEAALKSLSTRPLVIALPCGERTKNLTEAGRLYDILLEQKIARNDLILAVGGGVTTDLAGYVASTILRGVRWAAIPTTLLAMVDAAVGGKTGVNHRLGKNLIGTFWQPHFVYCDPSFVATLPRRELVAGLGEIVKYAGIASGDMVERLRGYVDHGDLLNMKLLSPLVEDSVTIKAGVVSRDEHEERERIILNYGHTFAHAIEQSVGYGRLRHGEAVILGIRAALFLGERQRIANKRELEPYTGLVDMVMPFVARRAISETGVMEAMALDKKRTGKGVRFVLLERPGKPIVFDTVSKQDTQWALRQMLIKYKNCGGPYV